MPHQDQGIIKFLSFAIEKKNLLITCNFSEHGTHVFMCVSSASTNVANLAVSAKPDGVTVSDTGDEAEVHTVLLVDQTSFDGEFSLHAGHAVASRWTCHYT